MSKMSLISNAYAQSLTTTLSTSTAAVTSSIGSAAQQASQVANPYGLASIWAQGDWVAKGCLLVLAILSIASWSVMLMKFLELRRMRAHVSEAHKHFANLQLAQANMGKFAKDNPLRLVTGSGLEAAQQYANLKPRVDYDTWIVRAIEQALSRLQVQMQDGLALLATIGSTSPFVGLFGTVWAIYTALVKIGATGQASIDRVAGPVGEALIMTAIGLFVAVPAVFGYNWLLRQNKLMMESIRSFGGKLHIVLLAAPTEDKKA
jgi:biopolymer transport protein ExbB